MLEEAEASFQAAGDSWRRCRCLTQLARIRAVQGEYEQARSLLEESLELYQSLDNQERVSWVLYLLAQVLFSSQADLKLALTLTEQGLALLKEIGFKPGMAYGHNLLGQIHLEQGDQGLARQQIEESVALFREIGDRAGAAEALMGLGRVLISKDDLTAARQLYQESFALLQEIHEKEFTPSCLEGLATVVAGQGELEWAARLWGTAEALREAISTPLPPNYRAGYQQATAAARARLGEETFARAWSQGRTMKPEHVFTNKIP